MSWYVVGADLHSATGVSPKGRPLAGTALRRWLVSSLRYVVSDDPLTTHLYGSMVSIVGRRSWKGREPGHSRSWRPEEELWDDRINHFVPDSDLFDSVEAYYPRDSKTMPKVSEDYSTYDPCRLPCDSMSVEEIDPGWKLSHPTMED